MGWATGLSGTRHSALCIQKPMALEVADILQTLSSTNKCWCFAKRFLFFLTLLIKASNSPWNLMSLQRTIGQVSIIPTFPKENAVLAFAQMALFSCGFCFSLSQSLFSLSSSLAVCFHFGARRLMKTIIDPLIYSWR